MISKRMVWQKTVKHLLDARSWSRLEETFFECVMKGRPKPPPRKNPASWDPARPLQESPGPFVP